MFLLLSGPLQSCAAIRNWLLVARLQWQRMQACAHVRSHSAHVRPHCSSRMLLFPPNHIQCSALRAQNEDSLEKMPDRFLEREAYVEKMRKISAQQRIHPTRTFYPGHLSETTAATP